MKVLVAAVASLLLSPAIAEDLGHEHHKTPTHENNKTPSPLVEKVRKATARFRDINVAIAEEYVAGPCVSGPNRGAMGVHLIKTDLLTKEVDAETPEALIYEPSPDGRMRLVGVEIITLASDWVNEVPVLDGHLLHYVGAPNRYGIPAFYEIHVWAWRNNPDGTFADWNPRVSCAGQPLPIG
ncbi:MAG: hypothetical protein WD944_03095 [Steroidobacteraceae bacterium]